MAKKVIIAQMQQRRDTRANWEATNPLLLDGELGIVTDDRNLYKVGDGVSHWNDLPYRGFDGTLVQSEGDSINAVMSQKAVTEAIKLVKEKLTRGKFGYSRIKNNKEQYFADQESAELYDSNPIANSSFLLHEIDLPAGGGGSSGGTSIDPELLEAYMPMSRDFSDDFNNDFAR